MPGRHVRFGRSMTCAPAGGENLPTCLIRSRSTAMTTFGSSWLDLPSNSAPQWTYTGPGGGEGTSFTGRGALSVSAAMFWECKSRQQREQTKRDGKPFQHGGNSLKGTVLGSSRT